MVVGALPINQLVVDGADLPVALSNEVVLFGSPAIDAPDAQEWADVTGTIANVTFTGFGGRMARRHFPIGSRQLDAAPITTGQPSTGQPATDPEVTT